MIVTGKKKNRITFDNSYDILTGKEIIDKYGIKNGKVFDFREYLSFIKDVVLLKSVYILSNYAKTKKELSEKLKQEFIYVIPFEYSERVKWHEQIIEKVITYLEKKGILDDYDYAYMYVHSHTNKSKNQLKNSLYLKGIDKNIIDEILKSEEIEKNELEYLKYQISKSTQEKQKIIKKFMNKGYAYSLIIKAFDEIGE